MNNLYQEARAKAYDRAEAQANKIKAGLCKNGAVTIKEGTHNPEKLQFIFGPEIDGCKNPRRHGSSYCQPCSDAHNARGV